ncbi:MAG: hypothetical protein DRI72_08910 [Bacteroidetes bacterium]|nr:MAG: hypothetical protein DRI72_08910 [Bacteroidota bacterium]
MEMRKSIQKRRIGIIITLLSLIGIVLIFEYCKIAEWNMFFMVTEIVLFIIFLASFVATFIKTGLWGFIHKPLTSLDEREIVLTGKSLRYAYSIFTVATLALLLYFAVTNTPIDMVLVVSLILFAHILPAVYIAWTEKEIYQDA